MDGEEHRVETSPEHLAALCIVEAAREAEFAVAEPSRWLLAIPLLHRAVNCALVVALRGSAGIGAFDVDLRRRWLRWLDSDGARRGEPRPASRVESFSALLVRARDEREPEMLGTPLRLDADQAEDLRRLTAYRDDIEHVKPRAWIILAGGMPRIAGAAAEAFDQLMFGPRPVLLHAPDSTIAEARKAVGRLRALAVRHPSRPPVSS